MRPVELRRVPLFATWATDALALMATAGRFRAYRAGETLFRAGAPWSGVSVLLGGYVRLYRIAPKGTERTVAIVGPGGLVGLAGLRGEPAHDDDAVALTAARAVELSTGMLLALNERDPRVLPLLAEEVATRIALGYVDAAADAGPGLPARVLRLLRSLVHSEAQTAGERAGTRRLAARLSHAELARLVGADRASVTRALQRLEAEGLIQREHGHVIGVATAAHAAWAPR